MRPPSRDVVTGFVVMGTTIAIIVVLFLAFVEGTGNGMRHIPW
jgi:hypothetical protein